MPLFISIWFLTGHAHLHPWQAHHNEGRVEWPPSQWRFLRALVAVAGQGLTSLPYADEGPPPKAAQLVTVTGMSKLNKRGVPEEAKRKLSFSGAKQTLKLNEAMSDAEVAAWKAANPNNCFARALDQLRVLIAVTPPPPFADVEDDKIPLSRLATLLQALSAMPTIWLPKTGGGHTRQYFPVHGGSAPNKPEDLTTRIVKNSGSPVFDTFATVRKEQPLVFRWPEVDLKSGPFADLKLIIGRLTYFGRAESWCHAEVSTERPPCLSATSQTHWECQCIEDHGHPPGEEYRDYTLERRLSPCRDLKSEAVLLMPRTKIIAAGSRPTAEVDFRSILNAERAEVSLLRCLLRESGQDINDGLERPIGTRWIHYAVPRAIYDLPRRFPAPRPRIGELVNLVSYALNTATVNRPVLPAVTDTLLLADRFRSAALALNQVPSRALSGHETDGLPRQDHGHAYWWPMDEDNDGFIDRIVVFAPHGFEPNEVDALRRLTRLRQRGGRPDLLVTPTYVGRVAEYDPWRRHSSKTFVSATPYFCPLHLSHGKSGGRRRAIAHVILESLRLHNVVGNVNEIESIRELVFDYDPESMPTSSNNSAVAPRQYIPIGDVDNPPSSPIPLAKVGPQYLPAYPGVCWKDPDQAHSFGLSVGLFVNSGTRFVRALSFCRNRRGNRLIGDGRMIAIRFREERLFRPFAVGAQCHFGMGLFVPTREVP